jgi:hypothetical protein
MVGRLIYLTLCQRLRWLACRRAVQAAKDAELLVLRRHVALSADRLD